MKQLDKTTEESEQPYKLDVQASRSLQLRELTHSHARRACILSSAPILWWTSTATIGLAILLAVGCGGEDFGTVSGTVEYEESAVPAGTKVFFELPGSGYVAAAKIDEQGAFQLTYKGSPKVRVGEYSVFFGPPERNLSQAEFFKLKKKVDAEYRKKGKRPPPSPDWVLPEKYYSPNTTTLKESVVSGPNEIELALED